MVGAGYSMNAFDISAVYIVQEGQFFGGSVDPANLTDSDVWAVSMAYTFGNNKLIGTVGQNVANKSPDFDPRNYGYKKLGDLVRAIDLFNVDERASVNSPAKQIYIRDKRFK